MFHLSQSRRKFIKSASLGSTMTFLPISLSSSTSRHSQSDFLLACKQGNLSKAMNLLTTDASLINAKDEVGRTGFTLAGLEGHSAITDFLKKEGYQTDLHESVLDLDWDRYDQLLGEETADTESKINDFHPMGGCVMWAAAAGGAGPDIWRVYAKCGIPDCQADHSSSPLEKALQFRDLPTAELTAAAMLSNNCEPDPDRIVHNPPLHLAASRGSQEMVELLISLGANPTRKNREGKTALQLAQKVGHKKVADLLENEHLIPRVHNTSRKAYNIFGEEYVVPPLDDIPLFLRRRLVGQSHGNFESVQKEVNADERLAHAQATTSEMCVEASAHMGRKNIVEFLLEKGAPYSICTAVMMNDMSTVEKYLREDPNRIHERGGTSLCPAMVRYHRWLQFGNDGTSNKQWRQN